MGSLEDKIAGQVLDVYDSLPAKFKPTRDSNGLSNWVPLSGIVFINGQGIIDVVAVATGMKCLPSIAVPGSEGNVLHDQHAETLAIRLLNHFLLSECLCLASSISSTPTYESPYLRWRREDERCERSGMDQPFAIRDNLKICMYCSEAPCGDASMELTIAKQKESTPWTISTPSKNPYFNSGTVSQELKGRGFFADLGIVRRKPGRGDAPVTLSKSCTDKLAMRQCISLLSATASLLISPSNAYLSKLILPSSQYIASACDRAFGAEGRMASVAGRHWTGGYAFRPFETSTTTLEFRYSKRGAQIRGSLVTSESKPSNIAATWNPFTKEVLIGGILQGRKRTDPKAASVLSRRRMFGLAADVLRTSALSLPALLGLLNSAKTYVGWKTSDALQNRRRVKSEVAEEALVGWSTNVLDDHSFQ